MIVMKNHKTVIKSMYIDKFSKLKTGYPCNLKPFGLFIFHYLKLMLAIFSLNMLNVILMQQFIECIYEVMLYGT